jgi:CubicO group peptidase (beta-lactamase class C family)
MGFRKFVAWGAMFLASHSVLAAGQDLNQTDVDAWLDGYMPYALHTADIPGAVVVVVKDGKFVTSRGFGYANLEKRLPVDPERTLFRPGSVSKLVTWTAVMQQVEQKKLDLDTDVNQYLDFKIPERNGKPITLRQIMTHTAGFEETIKDLIYYDGKRLTSLGQSLKKWVPERILEEGTTPAYSNYATALAGYMVERVSGESFDDYVERHIFTPLGMSTASFRQPLPAKLAPLMSQGYSKPGEAPHGFEIVGPAPAGSLSASGKDMGRFMLANLQHGELDGQRILSAAVTDTMHNSPLDRINPRSLIAPLNRMELGFFETNLNGREVIGHLGDTEAFHTSLHLFMKEGVGFYVSFNSGGQHGAANTLRMALFRDFADRYLPDVAAPDGKVDDKTAAEHARLMTGYWEVSRRSESSFFAMLGLIGQTQIGLTDKGGLLVPSLTGPNGRPREWVEIAPFVWRDKYGHDRFAAQLVDGQPVRWSMDFMSPFMVFDRVPAAASFAWLKPALIAALAVFLLTTLSAPAGWLARRKYRVAMPLQGRALKAYRGAQLFSFLGLAVLGGWGGVIAAMLGNLDSATSTLDPWLWLLQIAGVVAYVGAVAASAWNMKLTLADGRGKGAKAWSVLLFAAALLLLYTAWRFKLLAMTVNF